MRFHIKRANAFAPIASLALLVAVGGCAPLAQAPLVYSSKSSFGVDISATSTETPGISFAIGVKLVDAAYVPVAVAVPCDGGSADATPTNCTNERFKLHKIQGTSTLEDNSSPLAQLVEKTKNDLDAATAIMLVKQAEVDKATQDLKEDKALADTETTADADVQKAAADSPELAAAQARLKAARDAKDRLKITQEVLDKAKPGLETAKDETSRRERAYSAAVAARSTKSATLLTDAYSVFGTFDGDGNGKGAVTTPPNSETGAGGSLSVGKMFSTGIAAQNLSTAMRYQLVGACLERAQKAIMEAKADTELSKPDKSRAVAALYMLCPRLAQSR